MMKVTLKHHRLAVGISFIFAVLQGVYSQNQPQKPDDNRNHANQIEAVKIKAGTFKMGSSTGKNISGNAANEVNTDPVDIHSLNDEKPQHWVRLTQDFRMSKYQVTNAQYITFLNAKAIDGSGGSGKGMVSYINNGSSITKNETFVFDSTTEDRSQWGVKWNGDKWEPVAGYENHPVIYVTWYGAKAYADWIGGFLPTEAQWEYACRAGTSTVYSWGDTEDNNYMWYAGNNTPYGTKPVGQKEPNAWGVYDMHGNVYEWCLDQWDGLSNYQPADSKAKAVADPVEKTGVSRVIRGGSWLTNGQYCRSAHRGSSSPEYAFDYIGFRVVFVP